VASSLLGRKYVAMRNKRKYTKKIIVTDNVSTPEARAKRLKRLRNIANLTRQQLCNDSKINISTLKSWEIARYGGLPLDGAEKIIKRVAKEGIVCTTNWLLYETGIGPYILPNYQKIDQERLRNIQSAITNNDIEESLIINELLLFKNQFSETIEIRVEDDGLTPVYREGEFVAGIKHYNKKILSLINQNCIVQMIDGTILLRNLRKSSTQDKYTLVCTNPQTTVKLPIIYDIELKSAAPILRHYRKSI